MVRLLGLLVVTTVWSGGVLAQEQLSRDSYIVEFRDDAIGLAMSLAMSHTA